MNIGETVHHRIIGVHYKTGVVEFLNTTFYYSKHNKGATCYTFRVYNKRHPHARPNGSIGQGLLMIGFAKLSEQEKVDVVRAINRVLRREGHLPFESVADFEENAMTYCLGFGRIGSSRANQLWDNMAAGTCDRKLILMIREAEKGQEKRWNSLFHVWEYEDGCLA